MEVTVAVLVAVFVAVFVEVLVEETVAVFVVVWGVDFLVHGVWLQADYRAMAATWRDEAGMQNHIAWLFFAQLLWAVVFVLLWAKGFAEKSCLKCALIYGLLMGLFFQTNTLVLYAVQPLPGLLMVKWFAANVLEAVLAGIAVFFVYKPKLTPPKL